MISQAFLDGFSKFKGQIVTHSEGYDVIKKNSDVTMKNSGIPAILRFLMFNRTMKESRYEKIV